MNQYKLNYKKASQKVHIVLSGLYIVQYELCIHALYKLYVCAKLS